MRALDKDDDMLYGVDFGLRIHELKVHTYNNTLHSRLKKGITFCTFIGIFFVIELGFFK